MTHVTIYVSREAGSGRKINYDDGTQLEGNLTSYSVFIYLTVH